MTRKPAKPVNISREMKAIAKRTGGAVTLRLAPSGRFYAHAFPSTETARERVRASLASEGATSIGLHDLTDLIEREERKALASSVATTAEGAVAELAARMAEATP